MATNFAHSTLTNIGGNLVNNHYYLLAQAESQGSAGPRSSPLSFNDAPVDLLSVHFTGRVKDLAHLRAVLDMEYGDVPARCAIHGMPGLGKSQLTLEFAKSSFDQQRYSLIFWISATTVEKLNHGFANLLNLVGHPDRFIPEQRARLIAARRWLEECDDTSRWLLILDNVDGATLSFLREHLPRKNRRGNILFNTRTRNVAEALAHVAGQEHVVFELCLPTAQDAAQLLLAHLDDANDSSVAMPSIAGKAEEVVRCVGCLPLAVVQAASFLKQSHTSLEELLILYRSEHKIDVRTDSASLSLYSFSYVCTSQR